MFEPGRPLAPRTRAFLTAYRDELLRWNRQINLVSRRDPEATAGALIRQCVGAFDLWWGASGAELATAGGALRVFDLGSGGGLPAFVWLALLAERGVAAAATLVEPREKRAWFLERQARLPGAPAATVVAARWGEAAAPAALGAGGERASQTPILFTLKALRLSETAVLGGLATAAPGLRPAVGTPVELVRFQPAEGVTARRLMRELDIPPAETRFSAGGLDFAAASCRLLAPVRGAPEAAGAAGLLVSRHTVAGFASPEA